MLVCGISLTAANSCEILRAEVRSGGAYAFNKMHGSLQGSGACPHGAVYVLHGNSLVAMVRLVTKRCPPWSALRVSPVARSTTDAGGSGHRSTRTAEPGSRSARQRPVAYLPRTMSAPGARRCAWRASTARRWMLACGARRGRDVVVTDCRVAGFTSGSMVPKPGIEPGRGCPQRFLSAGRGVRGRPSASPGGADSRTNRTDDRRVRPRQSVLIATRVATTLLPQRPRPQSRKGQHPGRGGQ